VSDLSGVRFVVHQEEIKLPNIVDQELFETIREQVACLGKAFSYYSTPLA
jgi:hypothetical protein